jgi:hypothetical protein
MLVTVPPRRMSLKLTKIIIMVFFLYCFLQKDCDAQTLEFFCTKAKQNLDRLGMLILNTGHLHCHCRKLRSTFLFLFEVKLQATNV